MKKRPEQNVIIAGIPRSGTTLCCHLLNKLPDTIALDEPLYPSRFSDCRGPDQICGEVQSFIEETRDSLLATGMAESKHRDGIVPDNHCDSAAPSLLNRIIPRRPKTAKGMIRFDKDLSDAFTLYIKQPAFFTALLEPLSLRLPAYALIRNPVSILGSWNSVDMTIRKGRASAAENFSPDLAAQLDRCKDRYERQVTLLNWYYESYARLLPEQNLLRYEDIVSSRGQSLTSLHDGAGSLDEALENRNLSRDYDREAILRAGDVLLASDSSCWQYYSRESAEAVLKSFERSGR